MMKNKLFILIALFFFPYLCAYEDMGYHYLAKFEGCNSASLLETVNLRVACYRAANASGAHILNQSEAHFMGGGYTWFAILAESHASIHTYPEYNSCFIDLFTCGDTCDHEAFIQILKNYLQPEKTHEQCIAR